MCNNTKENGAGFYEENSLAKRKPSSPPRQEIGSQGMGGKQVETTKPFLKIYYE
jgi:hypothetical protein